MEMIGELYRFATHNDIPVEETLGDVKQLCDYLVDLMPDVLERWLNDLCFSFSDRLVRARNTSSRSIVEEAEGIHLRPLRRGRSCPLTISAGNLRVSGSYFSSIFKKETGTSFIGFLTECRMEKAARLLLETEEKNYVIAGQVGYADPNYFSYVFKRKFGVSPSKYRTEHTKREE